jgi:drug/metabolite transporter (DMT)-like permease
MNRASVLAFSTPIWVVPLAAWRLGERASRRALLGAGLGLLGVLAIAAPAFHEGGAKQILAYALLLGAALAWAISIVAVRAHRFAATPLALAPWQMLLAAGVLLPVALVVEGVPQPAGPVAAASLAFVGPVATAFAYWAVVDSARHYRAAVLSMALLAAPVLGILISALALGEAVGASLIAGAVLIAGGIPLATVEASTAATEPNEEAPSLSPSRKQIAFAAGGEDVDIVRVPLDGSRVDPYGYGTVSAKNDVNMSALGIAFTWSASTAQLIRKGRAAEGAK